MIYIFLQFMGAVAIVYGVALFSIPFSIILGGTMLLTFGVLMELTSGLGKTNQKSD